MQIAHLRDVLAEQVELLRHKQTTPQLANAITNASGKIISTFRLEFEYARMVGKRPKVPSLGNAKFRALPTPKKNGKEK